MLTRRTLLLTGAGALLTRGATIRYREYSRCLPDYLAELARDAYERRNRAIAKLTNQGAIHEYQRWARETFWRLAGGEPDRTPLQTRTTGTFERGGYRVEKLIYESQPGLVIPANLYIPTRGTPPFPGVLFQMGHSLNGKAAEPYQKCCQGLARLGYVVLAFDPMGQGERTYYPGPGGVTTRLDSADEEHTVPGRQMLLVGDTATRMQVWDAVRSLDVLAAHPLVDKGRLASTGQSGGGTLTMLLAAVDDRLAAAAVSSGNTENVACADFHPPGSTDDAEQNLLYSGPAAFDRWDLLYPMAPKPMLVLASARDFFGTYSPTYLSSGREEFAKLGKAYSVLGAGGKLEWDETPTPHALSYYLRTRIYAFFERRLKGRDVESVVEPPVQPEADEVLFAGPTGNVVRDFGSKTPLSLTRERAAAMKTGPVDAGQLRKLLELDAPVPVQPVQVARVPSEAADIAAIGVPTAPRVYAPAWVFVPRKADAAAPVLLVVEPGGRNVRWREGGLYHQLAAEGVTVCAADVRGIGDLRPQVSAGNPQYTIPHATEDAYGWSSLIFGKPLVGQQTADLLAFVRSFEAMPATRGRRVMLAATGHVALAALFATVLEPKIARSYLVGLLPSYRGLLAREDYSVPTANFLPGVLRVTDIPDLLSPRVVQGTAWDLRGLLQFVRS